MAVRAAGLTLEYIYNSGNFVLPVSDHNRQPIQVSYERIEKSVRTADGTLRKQVIATKAKYAISWEMLPSLSSKTVDGYYGAADLKLFYANNTGPINIKLTLDDGGGTGTSTIIANVVISDFSYEVVKRSQRGYDLVNVSIEFEEI